MDNLEKTYLQVKEKSGIGKSSSVVNSLVLIQQMISIEKDS